MIDNIIYWYVSNDKMGKNKKNTNVKKIEVDEKKIEKDYEEIVYKYKEFYITTKKDRKYELDLY